MLSLDQIINNPGYKLLATNILMKLDTRSLSQCRLLSKIYKKHIDNTKPLIILQIIQAIRYRKLTLFKKKVLEPGYRKRRAALISRTNNSNRLFYNLCKKQLSIYDLKIVLKYMKNVWAHYPFEKFRLLFVQDTDIFIFTLIYSRWNPVTIRKTQYFHDFVAVIYQLFLKNKQKFGEINIILEDILNCAIYTSNSELVESMLSHSISTRSHFNLNEPSVNGLGTPLNQACLARSAEIVKILLDYPSAKKINFNNHSFHTACQNGPIEIVDLFLDYIQKNKLNFDFNAPSLIDQGSTPMHRACDPKIISRMLNLHKEGKIYLDFNAQNDQGKVFWSKFVLGRYIEYLQFVLDLSMETDQIIDIDIQDNRGCTVLHYASYSEQPETVKLLLEHHFKTNRINPNAQNNDGDTPLHFACCNRNAKVVEVFVSFGLNNDIENNIGLTSIQVAEELGYEEIVQLLTQHVHTGTNG